MHGAYGGAALGACGEADVGFLRTGGVIVATALELAATLSPLQRNEAVGRTIGELVPLGAWTCHREGRCRRVTPPFLQMTRTTLEHVLGLGWRDRGLPADHEATTTAVQRRVASGSAWAWEYRLAGQDGLYRAVRSSGRRLRGSDDRCDCLLRRECRPRRARVGVREAPARDTVRPGPPPAARNDGDAGRRSPRGSRRSQP